MRDARGYLAEGRKTIRPHHLLACNPQSRFVSLAFARVVAQPVIGAAQFGKAAFNLMFEL